MIIEHVIDNKCEKLIGPLIITPKKFSDSRGFFFESWNQNNFLEILKEFTNIKETIDFKQDNQSNSKKGVVRGLHYQTEPFGQDKLVSCISGELFDVLVDIRRNSKSFGRWASVILNPENNKQIWIPKGFAHGFLALKDNTRIFYKTTNYWVKDSERTILWNDPSIDINWFLKKNNIHLSEKDQKGLLFSNLKKEDLY